MRNKHHFNVLKSTGYPEKFSKKKLIHSLVRTGLPKRQCENIADEVAQEICEGQKTSEIYRKTLRLLRERSPLAGVQYSLKRAIFELGPTGHHFEEFVARYFSELGYKTKTCQTLKGKWVNHEIDVIAFNYQDKFYVECKFHNRIGIKNDIKTALYVKARWDDLKAGTAGIGLSGFYLASNTAFSQDALKYAEGTGLRLLGVNAPTDKSFLEHIKELKLYPVTSLKSLNKHAKQLLIEDGLILAKDLRGQDNLLFKLGFSELEIKNIQDEVEIFF